MKNILYRSNALLNIIIAFLSIMLFLYCTNRENDIDNYTSDANTQSNNETVNNDLPKFEGKSFQLLICSANVYGFNLKSKNPEDTFKELDKLKRDNDDIVVIGLQECCNNPNTLALPGYKVFAANCSCDAIFVYQKKDFGITQQTHTLPLFHTDRYVNLLNLSAANNLTIANTHLVGGKFDDQHWVDFIDGREKQLQQILTHQPEFILGDFNADTIDTISGEYWQKLLQISTAPNKEANLKKYKTSGHKYLTDNNYTSTVNRDTVYPTTPFFSVVDWIYRLQENKSTKVKTITILEQGKIEAMNLNLSDHDFIWVRLKIELT